jgi:hypothetical protein
MRSRADDLMLSSYATETTLPRACDAREAGAERELPNYCECRITMLADGSSRKRKALLCHTHYSPFVRPRIYNVTGVLEHSSHVYLPKQRSAHD